MKFHQILVAQFAAEEVRIIMSKLIYADVPHDCDFVLEIKNCSSIITNGQFFQSNIQNSGVLMHMRSEHFPEVTLHHGKSQ